MTTLLNYIVWNPDVYLIQVGHWGLRWYSACWLLGLLGAYFMVKWLFYHQHIAEKTVFVGGKSKSSTCSIRCLSIAFSAF